MTETITSMNLTPDKWDFPRNFIFQALREMSELKNGRGGAKPWGQSRLHIPEKAND